LAYAKFLKDNDLVPGEMPGQKSVESKDEIQDDAEESEEADAVKETAEGTPEEAQEEAPEHTHTSNFALKAHQKQVLTLRSLQESRTKSALMRQKTKLTMQKRCRRNAVLNHRRWNI
jgi:hypothetical protein